MNTLKDYVDWKLTHAYKIAKGYPLTMKNCKINKRMKELLVYGNSVQDGTSINVKSLGELADDRTDNNYGKYKIPVVTRGINLFSMNKFDAHDKTINGITFTPLDDERVHIKGKVIDTSQTTQVYFYPKTGNIIPVKRGIYTSKSNGLVGVRFSVINSNNDYVKIKAGKTTEVNFDNAYIANVYLNIYAVQREFDDIICLQLEKDTAESPYEPYVEPITTNIYLDEPLASDEYIDFKNKKAVRGTSYEFIECNLPTLIAKTTIIEVDTSLAPSKLYGKYIKR